MYNYAYTGIIVFSLIKINGIKPFILDESDELVSIIRGYN